MSNFTDNQKTVLKFFLAQGAAINGGGSLEYMLSDNICLTFASDIARHTGKSRQSVGGIVSGLIKRGLVAKGDKRSKREYQPEEGGGQFELWLTDDGLRAVYALAE